MLCIFYTDSKYSRLESSCPRGRQRYRYGSGQPPGQIKRPKQGQIRWGIRGTSRPPLSIGIQPLLQTLQLGKLVGVVEPWEIWWSRNRNRYLNFKEQMEWIKVVDTGGTKSVSIYAVYDKLIKI